MATVTAHQIQLHCRILLAEETQYRYINHHITLQYINLATQHISSV